MNDIKRLVRSNIWSLQAYSSARSEFKGKAEVYLDANENPYGQWNRYPDPKQRLIKEKLSSINSINIDQIFLGNGSDEVIDIAMRIFCEPGKDSILILTPTYGMYEVSAQINDISLIKVPLNKDFQIDRDRLAKHFDNDKIKMIIICSPNNPTGNRIDSEDIAYVLNQYKGITIVDEAYIDFSDQDSLLSKTKKYSRLIISQTFSKAWGLAGARIGVAYAHSDIINLFNKVKPPYNISSLNQEAVLELLDNKTTIERNIQKILSEKRRVEMALSSSRKVLKLYPSDANFILIEVENAPRLYQTLLDNKIVVRNRSSQIPNTLRITIGNELENNQLLKLLQ